MTNRERCKFNEINQKVGAYGYCYSHFMDSITDDTVSEWIIEDGWKAKYEGNWTRIENSDGVKVVIFYRKLTINEAAAFKGGYDIGLDRGKIEGAKAKAAEISKTLNL